MCILVKNGTPVGELDNFNITRGRQQMIRQPVLGGGHIVVPGPKEPDRFTATIPGFFALDHNTYEAAVEVDVAVEGDEKPRKELRVVGRLYPERTNMNGAQTSISGIWQDA